MHSLITCPRCCTAKYTTKADDMYRCDGCGRECTCLENWLETQLDDDSDSPFYTDPVKRSEIAEKTPGVRARMLAERDAKEAARLAAMSTIAVARQSSGSVSPNKDVAFLEQRVADLESYIKEAARLTTPPARIEDVAFLERRVADLELRLKNVETLLGVARIVIG